MTTLREAAQQALEALTPFVRGSWTPGLAVQAAAAMDRLKAALAEPVEPVKQCMAHGECFGGECIYQRPAEPVEPVAWLRVIDEAMVTHHLGVADPTDDYETAKRKMNTLLSAAQDIGTYFAKQAEPVQEPQGCDHCNHPLYAATKCRVCGRVTEPVQEPVAWLTPGQDLHLNNGEGFRFSDWTPLYTAPPQREPLAEWQINDLMADIDPEDRDSWSFRQGVYAAEKHHGVRK